MLRAERTLHLWKLPITGMLMQSDEAGEMSPDPAQWKYSVKKPESVSNAYNFLIGSGAATSVCQQSLADSLGGERRGPEVELRSATGHQFTTIGTTTTCLRTRDSVNVASDFQIAPKKHWIAKVDYLGGTSVRQRQHHHVPQDCWNNPRRDH